MTRYVIHNHIPRRTLDNKPELSAYLTKAFGENWHKKGQSFPKPKQGSKEVSPAEYDKVVAQWRKDYAANDARANDKNLAYDVLVRGMLNGTNYRIRLFAVSQELAEERAKDRARQMDRIPLERYKAALARGQAIYRIVSSEVSPNQEPYQGDAALQKPYISKTGSTWELLDATGKVIATAKSMEALQSGLQKELGKYRSQVDAGPSFKSYEVRVVGEHPTQGKFDEKILVSADDQRKAAQGALLAFRDNSVKNVKVVGIQRAADLMRYSGDVIWIDIPENKFASLKMGDKLEVEGKQVTVIEARKIDSQFSGTLYRAKVRFK